MATIDYWEGAMMIEVTVNKVSGYIVCVNVEGHANYNEKGKDIVCASVSVLVQHTINACKNEKCNLLAIVNDGHVEVELYKHDNKYAYDYAQLFWAATIHTLKDLSEQYPDYIRVEEIDVGQ